MCERRCVIKCIPAMQGVEGEEGPIGPEGSNDIYALPYFIMHYTALASAADALTMIVLPPPPTPIIPPAIYLYNLIQYLLPGPGFSSGNHLTNVLVDGGTNTLRYDSEEAGRFELYLSMSSYAPADITNILANVYVTKNGIPTDLTISQIYTSNSLSQVNACIVIDLKPGDRLGLFYKLLAYELDQQGGMSIAALNLSLKSVAP